MLTCLDDNTGTSEGAPSARRLADANFEHDGSDALVVVTREHLGGEC